MTAALEGLRISIMAEKKESKNDFENSFSVTVIVRKANGDGSERDAQSHANYGRLPFIH